MADKDDLLAALEARGVEFLKSFDGIDGKRKRLAEDDRFMRDVKPRVEEETEDEWTGFGPDFAVAEDDMTRPIDGSSATSSQIPEVVVFADGASKPSKSKLQSRAFMSSKVSKLKESTAESSSSKQSQDDDEVNQDLSNMQNDALLHRLVHTKLLSGSLNPDLNMTPAQRRKALAGRVSEAAGESKLGKGETVVRQDEKNRASKRVREGMMAKQRQRDMNSLDEAKNAGNYHPALKKLFAASSTDSKPRKRERGLKMGVGRFSAGMLKLTPEDIGRVRDDQSSRVSGRSRGRGRGNASARGRGRGREKKH